MHKFLKFIFGIEFYMFRAGFLSIVRNLVLYTQLGGSQQNLFVIYLLLCIQYWTPDDGQKTCPKHV
jgi:hypothetical protein